MAKPKSKTPSAIYMRGQVAKLRPAEQLYIAGLDWDFTWTSKEIEDFIYLWNEGRSIPDMAAYFGRKQEELAILAMDLAEQGRIKPRPGGVFGGTRSR